MNYLRCENDNKMHLITIHFVFIMEAQIFEFIYYINVKETSNVL